MPQTPVELAIIEKSQALLVWTLKHIEKFPKVHRYGLGLRIEQRLSTILDDLIEAKFNRDRLPILHRSNLELERLRFQIRTAKDVKCLSIDSYGSASRFVNEIGQQLGMWIKSIVGGTNEATRKSVAGTDQFPQPTDGGSQRRPR